MAAKMDDPMASPIYRVSGEPPFPAPGAPLPLDILPRRVTLRDRVTTATLIPFSSPTQVPLSLMSYLCDQLGKEIEKGDTYPQVEKLSLEAFAPYWFSNFGAVMVLGDVKDDVEVRQMADEGANWDKQCLGSFYIKPNYPGRSSHVCNGGFLTTDASRNRGVGRLMGESYIDWAPKLGYTYSVFNLVYETNVASCRIWDGLGFKRIGRVKGCGNLRSHPDRLVDAIIFGRELGNEDEEDGATEERFDKIKYYLKHGKYPNGADRAEKSRLRSAATHYKLIPPDAASGEPEKLMLKGKEVVSDPKQQYKIACEVHLQQDMSGKGHAGINKTTATIAEKYHWERIKATVSAVIKNCSECKVMNKPPGTSQKLEEDVAPSHQSNDDNLTLDPKSVPLSDNINPRMEPAPLNLPELLIVPFTSRQSTPGVSLSQLEAHNSSINDHPRPLDPALSINHPNTSNMDNFDAFVIPVDPRIMEGIEQEFANYENQVASFQAIPLTMDDFPPPIDTLSYGPHDIPYQGPHHGSHDVP